MLGQFGHSRAMSANVGEIERRLRSIEQRLEIDCISSFRAELRVGVEAHFSKIQPGP